MRRITTILSILRSDFHLKELIKGSGLSLLFRSLGVVGVYIFYLIISKYYGPVGNGLYAFAWTIAVISAYFCNLGLNTYILRAIPTYIQEGHHDKVGWFYMQSLLRVFSYSVITGFILYYLLPYILTSLGQEDYNQELKLAALIQFPISLLFITSAAFRAKKNIFAFSLLQTSFIQTLAIALLILLHLRQSNILNPAFATIILGLICTGVGIGIWFKQHPSKLSINHKGIFKPLLKTARPMLYAGIVFFIMSWSDKIMLRFMMTQEGLGIYEIAQRLATAANIGLLAIITIAEPKFAELFSSNQFDKLKKFTKQSALISFIINTPIVIIIIALPQLWLNLFGHDGEYLPGTRPLIILGIAQCIQGFCGPTLNFLTMCKREVFVKNIIITTAIMNLILNFILIPKLGIEGAAIATLVGTVFWNLAAFLTIKKDFGFYPHAF